MDFDAHAIALEISCTSLQRALDNMRGVDGPDQRGGVPRAQVPRGALRLDRPGPAILGRRHEVRLYGAAQAVRGRGDEGRGHALHRWGEQRGNAGVRRALLLGADDSLHGGAEAEF